MNYSLIPLFLALSACGEEPAPDDSGTEAEADTDTDTDTDTDSDADADADSDTDTDTDTDCVHQGDVNITSDADVAALAGVCEVTGNFTAQSSTATDFDGLESLTTIRGWLFVYGNSELTNLDGLSGLTSADFINVRDNGKLEDLDGLSNVTSELSYLLIMDNTLISDLDGLGGLTSVDGNVDVFGNYSVCQSVVDAFVGGISVTGTTTAAPNNSGC